MMGGEWYFPPAMKIEFKLKFELFLITHSLLAQLALSPSSGRSNMAGVLPYTQKMCSVQAKKNLPKSQKVFSIDVVLPTTAKKEKFWTVTW